MTHDGDEPAAIAAHAKEQVKRYQTVKFYNGLATKGRKTEHGFEIQIASGERFASKKLIFATGIRDILPDIPGIAACWGISVLHCPYCHGYEVRNKITGILGNGEAVFDLARLISNWTSDLTVFTNGASTLSAGQAEQLKKHKIKIVTKELQMLEHSNGQVKNIIFKDGTQSAVNAIYAPVPFEQHSRIPENLGCELGEDGYIKIDPLQETSVNGVFACGDNTSRMRTVANAVAMGTTAGMVASKKMILEEF
ncbi:MAG: NAD(P)/FAD-dependent oxidoreductase [Sphingobacteriaceae bacterium]|nr:NAD(P)/FAD-dependent oxidoreductase [Sphingobacteriaceae bacterium]